MLGQRLAAGLFAAVAALTMGFSAHAQEKKIKIGVIFDLTGPLAGGGSELQYIGAGVLRNATARAGRPISSNRERPSCVRRLRRAIYFGSCTSVGEF
jgi:hypothetical protein